MKLRLILLESYRVQGSGSSSSKKGVKSSIRAVPPLIFFKITLLLNLKGGELP